MSRKQLRIASSMLVMGLSAFQPMLALAAEHGGTALGGGTKEHGGAAVGATKEHGGTAQATSEVALLNEAAAALRKGEARPDLAEKLEKLAKEEKTEKK